MLWIVLSYIPANVWRFLFITSVPGMWVFLFCLSYFQESEHDVFVIYPVLAYNIAAGFVLWSHVREQRFTKALRKREHSFRREYPVIHLREPIHLREIDVGWMAEHYLRMRIAGIIITCGIVFIISEILFAYSRTTGVLAILFGWWPVGILMKTIGEDFENSSLSMIVAAVLVFMAAFTAWYGFRLWRTEDVSHLCVVELVLHLRGMHSRDVLFGVTVGLLVMAEKIMSGALLLKQCTRSDEGTDPIDSSIAALSHEKMSWYSEGLKSWYSEGHKRGFVYHAHTFPYYDHDKNRGLVRLAAIVALLALVGGSCLAIISGILSPALPFVFAFPLIIVAYRAWEISKRLRLRTAEDVLASDPRPPVLLLRSFSDDSATFKTRSLIVRDSKVLEVAATWFSALGPVFTFGRPGERLADAGPPRIYVDNDDWQRQMLHYMDVARLIVLVVGEAESLTWEVRQIVDLGLLHKTIFVFPPRRPQVLYRCWQKLRRCFAPTHEVSLRAIDSSTALLLGFDKGTIFCLTSKIRSKLAYDIAFKALVVHLEKCTPALNPEPQECIKFDRPRPGPSSIVPGA